LTIHFFDNDGSPPNAQLLHDIIFMSSFVDEMLVTAIDSFESLDLEKAARVIRQDEELDDEFRSALRRLSTFLMEDARNVGHVVDIVLGLRALERIGGQAKNIAGYMVFLVKGVDVRHENLERVMREIVSGK